MEKKTRRPGSIPTDRLSEGGKINKKSLRNNKKMSIKINDTVGILAIRYGAHFDTTRADSSPLQKRKKTFHFFLIFLVQD